MSRTASRALLALLAASLCASLTSAGTSGGAAGEDRWWADYAGGPTSSRYFDSTRITRDNVTRLEVAWTYPYGETGSNPLVVHGVVYGRGRNGSLVALDARTGKEIWIREGMQAMTARGMNYWESADGTDRRLIFSMNDYLQQIDATTGKPVYSFGRDDVVDLREGLGRDPATIGRIQSGSPAGFGPPGFSVYQRDCAVCHGPDRSGTQNGPSLQTVPGRLDAATVRATIADGKGRMPAFPHLNDVEMETLVSFIVAPPDPGGGRGRGSVSTAAFPPGPVVGSGGARVRELPPGGRGRRPRPYPDGIAQTPQYVINAYGTIGIMMKPPFTKLVKYDLNAGTIKWEVGLGDDARLAAHGITGTGVTQMRSSLIVTSAGLIFAPGGDSRLRAYDSESGALLWTSPPLAGTIRGGHSMYEMGGRQYVLVAASGEPPPAGRWPRQPGVEPPTGYIAFALPAGPGR